MPKGFKLVACDAEQTFLASGFETAKRSRKPKNVADIGVDNPSKERAFDV